MQTPCFFPEAGGLRHKERDKKCIPFIEYPGFLPIVTHNMAAGTKAAIEMLVKLPLFFDIQLLHRLIS